MLIEKQQKALKEQRVKYLYRVFDSRDSSQGSKVIYQDKTYLSFCSNDYLGLSNHPKVVEAFKKATDNYGVGSGASHVLSGHCSVHDALEEALAAFLNYPDALVFSTGYMANLGVINTLIQRKDLLIQDHNNHASLIDAGLLARCEMRRYQHNNCQHLEKILQESQTLNKYIVTQGIFSMSGELAPLPDIVQLAKSYNSYLIVDDAHGIGCLGKTGRGTLEHYHLTHQDIPILIGTLSKALGTFGAFVAGDASSIETLRQFARTYIYTTALPPAICAATCASIALIQEENWRQLHLKSLIHIFREGAKKANFKLSDSMTAIQSIEIGSEAKALQYGEALLKKGILIKAIRYPTVPLGQACLRINLSATHTKEQIILLLEALHDLF